MALSEKFGAIVAKANELAQTAAQKTKDAAAIGKAKVAILAEEDKIKKAQVELGKLYYRDFAEGSEPEKAEYLPWCEKIGEAKAAIEALRASIEEIKTPAPAEEADEVVTDADLADLEIEVLPDAEPVPEAPAEQADEPQEG